MDVRTKNSYNRRHLSSLMGGGESRKSTCCTEARGQMDIENLEVEYGGGQTLVEEQFSISQIACVMILKT